MYGKPNCTDVDRARYELTMSKFKASKGVLSGFEGSDLCYQPPCRSVLKQHIKRVNYQCFVWRADQAFVELPSLQSSGWNVCDDTISIVWNIDPIVPEELCSIQHDPSSRHFRSISEHDSDSEADDFEIEDAEDDEYLYSSADEDDDN